MKTSRILSIAFAAAALVAGQSAHAQTTYTWANSNVTGTPAATLNWFNPTQGTWTGGTPVSSNLNTIRFFQDTTTALPNTATPSTQTSNIDNGGSAFQLATLTLSGRGSATANANLTMTISGDALNFSAPTGTINLDGVNNTRTLTYNLNSNLQLGTASSANALTIQGAGNGSFVIGGIISELQAGGGSLVKLGTSTVFLSGSNSFTGGTSINAGTVSVGSIGNTGSSGNLGNVSTINFGSTGTAGTLTYTGAGETTDRAINLAGTTGGAALNANGAGALVFSSNVTVTGSGAKTIALGGTGANTLINTLQGTIGDNGGATSISKGNVATWALTNTNNSFTGAITVNQGILQAATINVGGSNSSIGAGNAINLNGASSGVATLRITGAGGTTDRTVTIVNNGANGGVLDSSGAGAINFTGPITTTNAATSATLNLSGTSALTNAISGNISDSPDTTKVMSVTKNNAAATWVLSGTGSTYTGATTVSGGILAGIGANAFGNTSGISIAGAGVLSLRGDSSTSFVRTTGSSSYGATTTATGATINVDQATVSGTAAKTMTIGAVGTTSVAATYTLNLSGTNNTSLSLGAVTGAASTAAGTVTLQNTILGGGTLTIASYTSANTTTGETFTLGFGGAASSTKATTVTGLITQSTTPLSLRIDGSSSGLGLSGIAILQGNNAFTGNVTIGTAATLSVSSIGNSGASGNLGAGTTINLGSGNTGATLLYTGTGESTSKVLNLNSTATGVTIDQSGASGNLRFTGANTATGLGNKTLTLQGSTLGTGEISGAIVNSTGFATALTKAGTGTWTVSGSNTYTGATMVNAGTLIVASSGGISNSSAVTVAGGGTFVYNSSLARTGGITLNGAGSGSRATLGGSGQIDVALTLNNLGDTLSPGNSPGIQNYGVSQTWNSFSYLWELNDFVGITAGTAFDQIGITGALSLTGGTGAYVLNITSLTAGNVAGNVPNFSETNRSWSILTTTGGITGFNAANWTLSTANFTSSPAFQGTYSLAQSGNDLVLSYAAVPEPSTLALLALGLTAMVVRRRRSC